MWELEGKERKERRKIERKEKKGRDKREESNFYWFSSTLARRVQVQKGAGLHSKVGFFSYSGYPCLRVIQWPWSSALTVGLVHDSLDQTVVCFWVIFWS